MVSGSNQSTLYALIEFSNHNKMGKKKISPEEHRIIFDLSEKNIQLTQK